MNKRAKNKIKSLQRRLAKIDSICEFQSFCLKDASETIANYRQHISQLQAEIIRLNKTLQGNQSTEDSTKPNDPN